MEKENKIPRNVQTIYYFFDKTKDPSWKENPFKFYTRIKNVDIKIAKNISNLNFYQIDFPINKAINSLYIIKYFQNINYRNYFSADLKYREIKRLSGTEWVEEETYNGSKSIFNCIADKFQLLLYTSEDYLSTNISEAKYYISYKIFNAQDFYILRFETVFNHLDMDQFMDLNIYINMIINILKSIYKTFKIEFPLNKFSTIEPIQEPESNDNTTVRTLESFL